LVVGASSGLGRGVGVALARAGAKVALAGRRKDRLEDAAEEAGADVTVIPCDVQDPADCEAVVATSVDRLGGLDALIYTPGVSHLGPMLDADAEAWQRVLATNVIGATLVTRAAVPHLRESGGRVIFFSSESAYDTPPWPGIGPYVVSKHALNHLIEAWRVEHPEIAFTRLVVGGTPGEGKNTTEFANAWDPELAGTAVQHWVDRGYLIPGFVALQDLIDQVVAILASGADLQVVVVRARPL
jgi:NAD(P)-dependent dehydrogenase (short-subunit alcohol dehydrogenase family)